MLREALEDAFEVIDGLPVVIRVARALVQVPVQTAGHVKPGGRPGSPGIAPVYFLELIDAHQPVGTILLLFLTVEQLAAAGFGFKV